MASPASMLAQLRAHSDKYSELAFTSIQSPQHSLTQCAGVLLEREMQTCLSKSGTTTVQAAAIDEVGT